MLCVFQRKNFPLSNWFLHVECCGIRQLGDQADVPNQLRHTQLVSRFRRLIASFADQ
jgi:hypothetical protein